MKNSNNRELVTIFKVTYNFDQIGNEIIGFVPIDVIEGIYIDDDEMFVDTNGTGYIHLINNPENYGFYNRCNIEDVRKQFPKLPLGIIKKIILEKAKKNIYRLGFTDNDVPIILTTDKKMTTKAIVDIDLINYYSQVYPKFLEDMIGITLDEDNENKEDKNSNIQPYVKNDLDINKVYKELIASVLCQDEQIKKILVAIWKQYNDFSSEKSRNILINGSTGVGKTEIFRILSKMLNIPTAIVSATQYSATGYVGRNVEDMLSELLHSADGDLEKAQNGILIIDEVDKLSQNKKDSSSVNQRDVQEGLLKIIEDGTFIVPYKGKEYNFNTSKVMVIAMGSWSRIELKTDKIVGFEQTVKEKRYKDLTMEDLINNGMTPEFVGRFSNIIQMNELDYNSLLNILNNSKRSTLNLQKEFFRKQNIELVVEEEAKRAIANMALKKKLGARSLDEILETALADASFEIATNPNIYQKLIITEETISKPSSYKLIKRKK